MASKQFIDQLGKSLLQKFCQLRDAHLISCIENIVATLDAEKRLRDSLNSEFLILYHVFKCKQGQLEYFNTILSSKVSSRFFKGIFNYLWSDTIESKFFLI